MVVDRDAAVIAPGTVYSELFHMPRLGLAPDDAFTGITGSGEEE